MSQRNVAVVVGTFESTNARDFEAAIDAYADDVVLVLHDDLVALGSEGAVGKEAVSEWFGDWLRTFERGYRFELEEARDWGDRVFVVATHHGRGRLSSAPIRRRAAWIYAVRDGRITRIDIYSDPESALRDAGPPDG